MKTRPAIPKAQGTPRTDGGRPLANAWRLPLAVCGLICSQFVVCGPSQSTVATRPTEGRAKLIQASAEVKPYWATQPPAPDGRYYYFVGEAPRESTEEAGMATARADALERYATFLGVDVTVLQQVHQTEMNALKDDIVRIRRTGTTDIELLATVLSRGVLDQGSYWEKLSEGGRSVYFRCWRLTQVSARDVEAERARIDDFRRGGLEVFGTDRAPNMGLHIVFTEPAGGGKACKAGDTVHLAFQVSENCYLYLLDAWGDKLDTFVVGEPARKGVIYTYDYSAAYGNTLLDIVKLIASSKSIEIGAAIKLGRPMLALQNIRDQQDKLGASYAESHVRISIEP